MHRAVISLTCAVATGLLSAWTGTAPGPVATGKAAGGAVAARGPGQGACWESEGFAGGAAAAPVGGCCFVVAPPRGERSAEDAALREWTEWARRAWEAGTLESAAHRRGAGKGGVAECAGMGAASVWLHGCGGALQCPRAK